MNKRNYNSLGGGYTGKKIKGAPPTKPNIQNALIKPNQENSKLKKDIKNDTN